MNTKLHVLLMIIFCHLSLFSQTATQLNFDGSDDQVNLGSSLTTQLESLNTITLEALVRPTSISGNGVIVGNYGYPTNNAQLQLLLRRDGNSYNFLIDDGAGIKQVSAVNIVQLNVWQHVAGTWDGSSIRIYVDGVLQNTTTGVNGSSFRTSSNSFAVGYGASGEAFSGDVDEVRIWSSVRTQSQISANSNVELSGNEPDLLVYYQFNQGIDGGDNSSETILNDITANGNNGTLLNFDLNGATSNWLSGSPVTTPATHLNFDGTDDYVDLSASTINDLSQGTIETWVYLNDLDNQTIFAKQSNGENSYAIFSVGAASAANGQVYYQSQNGVGILSNTILSTGQWYHLAITFNDTGANLYIDGVLDNTASGNFSLPNDTTVTATSFGAWLGDGNGQYLNGNIDDFRVWNTTRTAQQISESMSSELQGNETGLLVYYNFNQGISGEDNTSETILYDITLNGFNGALTNFSLTGTTSNWLDGSPVSSITTLDAPTTNFATQIYTGDDKTLANLQVTGDNIIWYDASTDGSVLPISTILADETTYYASQTVNGIESTERVAISVNRISDNEQTLEPGSTVSDLVATPSTGSIAQWYTTASDNTVLEGTAILDIGTYYLEELLPETITELTGGFNQPFAMVVESDGKILVSDAGNNSIKRVDADGTNITTVATGINTTALNIDLDGRILVADASGIRRMEADGSNIITLASGLNVRDFAIQSDGKILIVDTGNGAIKRMDSDGTNIVTLATGFNIPSGILIQPDGKILIADTNNHMVKRMDADGTNIETLGSGFNFPFRVDIQPDGKILVVDHGNSLIKRMDSDGSNIEVLGAFTNPFDAIVESNNNFLILDTANNAIKRLQLSIGSNRVPVMVDVALSVNTFEDSDFVIYPNPASSNVSITYTGFDNVDLDIYDINGRLIMTKKELHTYDSIEMEDYESGIYLFSFNTLKGEVIKRVIKN